MAKAPNILLITTDEQRFDTYGAPTSAWPQPPNLARLRSESTLLTNTYSNTPICMPCRYTWLTGLYGSQTERGPGNGYDWPDYHKTMPQALQGAGYHTSLIGKLHASNIGTLTRHHLNELEHHAHAWGFDTVFECSGREIWSHSLKSGGYGIKGCHYTDHLRAKGLYEKALEDCIMRDLSRKENGKRGLEPYQPGVLEVEDTMDGVAVEEMCRFVRDYQSDKPFFLHASFFAPHYPLDVPPEYFNLFKPEDMPPPTIIKDPDLIRRWQENRAMYMGLTFLVDDLIGRLLQTVRDRGLMENTVVLFTTDHGDMLGDDHFARKGVPHEGSARTPIMVRQPGWAPENTILPGLAEQADLPQTILEVGGLSDEERAAALPESPGRSFWQYVNQGGDTFRESAYSEFGGELTSFSMRMVRAGSWKYVRSPKYGNRLYDLEMDPYEEHNRIDDSDCGDRVRAMQEMLIDRMAKVRVPPIQGRFRG